MLIFPTRISRISRIFDSFGVFPLRPNENIRCLQRKRIREIRVGNQEGSGQDEQVSVQGDDLTMLSEELIPDVPSDYSGLHPADALSLVSDARRLGLLQAYILVSCGSATTLAGVVSTSGILPGIRVGIRGGAIP